jgi:hypothetical protein
MADLLDGDFAEHDYIVCDVIRSKIWGNRRIPIGIVRTPWSSAIGVRSEPLPSSHSLRLSLVHPEQMDFHDALRAVTVAAPKYAKETLKWFLKR